MRHAQTHIRTQIEKCTHANTYRSTHAHVHTRTLSPCSLMHTVHRPTLSFRSLSLCSVSLSLSLDLLYYSNTSLRLQPWNIPFHLTPRCPISLSLLQMSLHVWPLDNYCSPFPERRDAKRSIGMQIGILNERHRSPFKRLIWKAHSESNTNFDHSGFFILWIPMTMSRLVFPGMSTGCTIGWLRLIGSLKLQVSFAEYHLF